MDPALKGQLLGSAGPCSGDSLAQLPALQPTWLEAAVVLAPEARAYSRYAVCIIEPCHEYADWRHQLYRYASDDPAINDEIAVRWLAYMIRSADSILVAEEEGRKRCGWPVYSCAS